MSLINEMLKDLSRQHKTVANATSPLSGVLFAKREHNTFLTRRIGIYVSLLVILIGAWWLVHSAGLLNHFRPQPSTAIISYTTVNKDDIASPQVIAAAQQAAPPPSNTTTPVITDNITSNDPVINDDAAVVKLYQPMTAAKWQAVHYKKAMDFAAANQWELAITELQSIVAKYPEYNEARDSLAGLLIKEQQYPQAQQLLHDGLNMAPDYSPFLKMQAHLLIALHKTPQAIKLLTSHSPDMDEDADYYALLAALYEKQGESTKSGAIYRALVQSNPQNSTYWFGLAIAMDQINNASSAQAAYKEAVRNGQLRPDLQAYASQRLQLLKG